jgi:acyl-CoA thioester hydrolase
MVTFVYQHRVRYRECDPMGVVYHTHYLDYFEVARTEALRPLGLSYREVEERGIFMPVIDASIRYVKPIYYDDLVEINVVFPTLPTFRFETRYEIRRSGETQVLATGSVTLCFVEAKNRRPLRAPAFILDVFKPHWPIEESASE